MKPLFEIKPVDREFYESRLRDFLPGRIIDIHTHVWLDVLKTHAPGERDRVVKWPALVARDNSIEDLIETYRLMFPGKEVSALIFASARPGDDIDKLNAYVAEASGRSGFPALIFASPEWSADILEEKIRRGGFAGVKVYLDRAPAYIPEGEIRIFDFLPHHQLEVLNRHGWIAMLHIPRDGRLKDPVNIAQMVEIDNRYPNAKVIIAHVGRAYCNEDVGDAFEALTATDNLRFDIAANTNEQVFRQLIQAVGPKRILFGSDMPILRMRTRRICESGVYVNLVPEGLYGDVSVDKHMRELTGSEADNLTFFMYEEIDAFRRAAEAEGLARTDIEDVFCNNASALIEGAREKEKPRQLCMIWPLERLGTAPSREIPPGYAMRTFRPGDEEAYIAVMRAAGFETWGESHLAHVMARSLPGGIFFLLDEPTGAIVATACALHNPTAGQPFGGEMGWVAVHPDRRSKALGFIVTAAATNRLIEAGYGHVYLLTDDFRLPALKTYLKMGWAPQVALPGMERRWQDVCNKLGFECP